MSTEPPLPLFPPNLSHHHLFPNKIFSSLFFRFLNLVQLVSFLVLNFLIGPKSHLLPNTRISLCLPLYSDFNHPMVLGGCYYCTYTAHSSLSVPYRRTRILNKPLNEERSLTGIKVERLAITCLTILQNIY